MQRPTTKYLLLGFIIGAIVTSAVGRLIFTHNDTVLAGQSIPVRQKNSPYTFVNPVLYYETPETKSFTEYTNLEKKIDDFISQNKSALQVDNASVYFRDLTHGYWVGINENDTYQPHSLLKVAYLIAYLKEVDSDPRLLDKMLLYAADLKREVQNVPLENNSDLVVGQSYTVKVLLDKMIVKSDNVAKDILLAHIDQNSLTEVFTDLGIEVPENGDYVISTKTYASFFRILYNSTYLSRDSSEAALQLLNNAEFEYGIRASIPASIKISHKYGIDAPSNTGNNLELHDCGIVYKPGSPYLICIMTKGHSIPNLSTMIQGVSDLVYKDFK